MKNAMQIHNYKDGGLLDENAVLNSHKSVWHMLFLNYIPLTSFINYSRFKIILIF